MARTAQTGTKARKVTPHAGLWTTALRIAGGDKRKIEVQTPTRLVVKHN